MISPTRATVGVYTITLPSFTRFTASSTQSSCMPPLHCCTTYRKFSRRKLETDFSGSRNPNCSTMS